MQDNVSIVEQIIGYEFADRRLIKSAITHSSASDFEDYQRMEFLGDSIVDFLVAEYLFVHFNRAQEGVLTQMRATLVDKKAFSSVMQKYGLDKLIIHSEAFGKQLPQKMISDVYESIVAAIYLDSGSVDSVRDFIFKTLIPLLDENKTDYLDYKSKLFEYCQKNHIKPEFVSKKSGVDHKPSFVVELYLDGVLVATQEGKTIKETEKACAKTALTKLSLI